ncbi:TPA: alpha/beta hydrolase, partial [Vibrio vulnificus]|nr:alpha/beta hydrolase [Vibrio vulnificus]
MLFLNNINSTVVLFKRTEDMMSEKIYFNTSQKFSLKRS